MTPTSTSRSPDRWLRPQMTPDLEVMDRLSYRYMGEPWQERKPCVSALVEIDRWRT